MNRQWQDIKKGVREGLSTAAEKVEFMARIAKAKLEISTTKRSISSTENQLGRRVYDLVSAGKSGVAEDGKVKTLVGTIKALEIELADKEAQLEELKLERETKKEPESEIFDEETV